MHDREGAAENAPIASLTPDGRRTWGVCRDRDTLAVMTAEEVVGRSALRAADGTITLPG
jgi:hypothetical protein